jgi:hypothetical protein
LLAAALVTGLRPEQLLRGCGGARGSAELPRLQRGCGQPEPAPHCRVGGYTFAFAGSAQSPMDHQTHHEKPMRNMSLFFRCGAVLERAGGASRLTWPHGQKEWKRVCPAGAGVALERWRWRCSSGGAAAACLTLGLSVAQPPLPCCRHCDDWAGTAEPVPGRLPCHPLLMAYNMAFYMSE